MKILICYSDCAKIRILYGYLSMSVKEQYQDKGFALLEIPFIGRWDTTKEYIKSGNFISSNTIYNIKEKLQMWKSHRISQLL